MNNRPTTTNNPPRTTDISRRATDRCPVAHVRYQGRSYWHTGKLGTRVRDGKPSAEYRREGGGDERVWALIDGSEVAPD